LAIKTCKPKPFAAAPGLLETHRSHRAPLDDSEKEWWKKPQRSAQPKLLPVDFRSPLTAIAQSN
jgi:hypothetical protein